MTSNAWKK